jgi:hypothetical protein
VTYAALVQYADEKERAATDRALLAEVPGERRTARTPVEAGQQVQLMGMFSMPWDDQA